MDEDNVIDLDRLLPIMRKLEQQGREALTPSESEELDRATRLMRQWWTAVARGPAGREADHALGLKLADELPEHLLERWGKLTPSELGLLARVFPEELPPEARTVLPPEE